MPALLTVVGLLLAAVTAAAAEEGAGADEPRYIFGWPFIDTTEMSPRGGTTEGPELTVETTPGAVWRKLQAEDAFNSATLAERREKDRAFGKLVRSAVKAKSRSKE